MFEDACCMCGKPTTGSNACKSQDYYPNLDDTPLLIPSRPQHSLSSSPTSSVMTTLSITDDLPPQVQPSAPMYGTTTAAAVAAAFARTSMPPTPGEGPRRTPNSKHHMPLFQPAIQETSPALTPRKHRPQPTVDVENTLHYVRRTAHQRSASSSTTSLLLSPASSSHEYNDQTMRNTRKQQRASLPAYFSLLETPAVTQREPHIEAWAMPRPHYPKPTVATENSTVAHSSTTPLASDSGSVSPTLVASLPGSPPDSTVSVHYSTDSEYPYPDRYLTLPPLPTVGDPLGATELGRKRRRIDADYLIDVEHPNSHARPLKLARQSLDPAPDHDLRMRYTHATLPAASEAFNGTANGVGGNGIHNGKSESSSSLALVQPAWSTLYEDSVHDREQVVRTMLQALRDVGYTEAAATLERESGYRLESDDVTQLRHAVTTGLWDDAPLFLRRLGVAGDNERTARFLISQQKYLEQLEALQPTAALQTLRGELAVYCTEPERLHYLSRQVRETSRPFYTNPRFCTPESSLIMCSSGADVMERARWDGAMGTSRPKLLAELQRLISPSIMLPPRRLDTLLSHARTYQRSSCTHHAGSQADKSFSLYVNHSCSRTQFPTLTTHILAEHLDEVWRLEWSHDGRFLASASQDKTAIIWKISDLQPDEDPTTRECVAERVLSGHEYAVNALAWSPDDKILLTSAEHIIKMWDVSNSAGDKLYELGAVDEKPLQIRVTDLTITPDGLRLIAVGTLVVPPPTNNNFDPSRQTRSMKVFSLSSRNELL
ncbi:hypothetical protein FRC11_006268 [Ceratobasidium sp. 423]|nr:hypothetical protein FRC11_006268 [Ceratobasidium sp. 423]